MSTTVPNPLGERFSAQADEVPGRAVDEDVEASEGFNGLRDHGIDLGWLAHVARDRQANARRARRISSTVGRKMLVASAGNRDVAPGGGQRQRNAAADAGAAARDQRRAPAQKGLH